MYNIRLFDTYGALCVGDEKYLFDIEDLPIIQSRDWYRDKDGYLVSGYFYKGQKRITRFHRIIMNAKINQCVDHINKNKADNRKQNLRICKHAENDMNRSVYKNNSSGISGVRYDKQRNKWVANITYQNTRIFLGRFDSKEEAVKARLDKEISLFKDFAPQRVLWERINKV